MGGRLLEGPTMVGRARREKKESTGRRLIQPCPPCAKPSSNSSLDHRRSDIPTAENGFATRYSMNKSAKVALMPLAPLSQESRYTCAPAASHGCKLGRSKMFHHSGA